MDDTQTKKWTIPEIEAVEEGLTHYFPYEAGFTSNSVFVNDTWSDYSGYFNWTGRDDFFTTLSNITGVQSLKEIKNTSFVLDKLKKEITTEVQAPKSESRTTFSEQELKEKIKASDEKFQQEEEIKQRQARTVQAGIEKQKELYEKQQQIIKQQIADAKTAQQALKDKVIYATVTTPQIPPLDEKELKDFQTLQKFAQSGVENQKKLVEDLEKIIESKISPTLQKELAPEEIKIIAQNTASDIVSRLNSPQNVPNIPAETAILSNIASDTTIIPKIIADKKANEALKNTATTLAAYRVMPDQFSRQLSRYAVGEKFTILLYGPEPDQYSVNFSSQKIDGFTHLVNLGNLNDNYIHLQENQNTVLDTVKDFGQDQARSFFANQTKTFIENRMAALPADSAVKALYSTAEVQGILANYGLAEPVVWEATNWFGGAVLKFSPESAPLLSAAARLTGYGFGIQAARSVQVILATESISGGAVTTAGITSTGAVTWSGLPYSYATTTFAGAGVTGGVVTETTGQIASKVSGQVAVKAGLAGLIGKIATAIGIGTGPVTFGIGALVGAAFGWVAKKVQQNLPKIKKWFSENAPTLAILSGVGLMLTGGPLRALMIIPTVTFGGIALTSGGLAAVGAGIVGTWFILRRLLGSIVVEIGLATIVILVSIPPLVALIMFIINSGAYMVPPSALTLTSQLSQENPYISVVKTAIPGRSGNPSPVLHVTYSVTITALKGQLSDIKIVGTKCNVVKKDKSKINCPPEIIPPLDPTLVVIPGSPYTFTFSMEYDSRYSDSLVYDSIEISAVTAEGTTVTTSGSATVCIGDCPTDCINADDSSWSGNPTGQSNLRSAISTLSGSYPEFTKKVCSDGKQVNLCYTTSDPSPIGALGVCNQAIFARHIHQVGGCDINFNQCGIKNSNDALFILTHELSHHAQKLSGQMISQYVQHGAVPLCTYGGSDLYEGSAESNALFTTTPSWESCVSSYSSQYPNNYSFAQQYMTQP